MKSSGFRARSAAFVVVVLCLAGFAAGGLAAQTTTTVFEDWSSVKAPPAPQPSVVSVDSKTTAFLVLDMLNMMIDPSSRPRVGASVAPIKAFLDRVRAKGMMVAYSITSNATPADILKDLSPQAGDPVVKSGVDKFYNTDLEQILSARGIKTVIIVGTAANGAVLHTATGAALRGLKVVIPVEGMSADNEYAEQYTAWHMISAPGTRRSAVITKFPLITIN